MYIHVVNYLAACSEGGLNQNFRVFRLRRLYYLIGRAFLHDFSFMHDQNTITEGLHQSKIMADKQKGQALGLLLHSLYQSNPQV